MWTHLKQVPAPIAILFALAGFIPAYSGSAYSSWVKNLYAQNNQIARVDKCIKACQADREPGVDCVGTCEVSAHKDWYRENIALTQYADRQWWIWALAFPASITLAVFVAMSLGWLPGVDSDRVIAGAMILFGASVVVAILTVLLQYLAFIPASVAYAFLLARASAVMSGRIPKAQQGARRFTFRLLLLGIPAGMILGGLIGLLVPTFSWFAGIEVTWGLAFGASLNVEQAPA